MQSLGTFFFIQVDQSFSIAVGAEAMASADEVVAQFLIVVNLAVEDYPDAAVLIRDDIANCVARNLGLG